MVLKEILEKSQTKPEDTVEFYHVCFHTETMKKILDEGAKAIGQGLGGQKEGFYLWTNKAKAEQHVSFLNNGYETPNQERLLVGVRVSKAMFSYPDWQIDYEASSRFLINLFDKYTDQIVQLKNFSFKCYDDNALCLEVKKNKFGPHRFCYEFRRNPNSITGSNFNLEESEAKDTGFIQAVCDKMCSENPEFLKDYNQTLQESLKDKKGGAVKYTGEKPLIPSYIALIQPDQKGHFEETVLYTDQKPAEKQVCPFFTVGLKKLKTKGK